MANGPLRRGHRLIPRLPFTLGGEYSVANLVAVPEAEAMTLYRESYRQCAMCPMAWRRRSLATFWLFGTREN